MLDFGLNSVHRRRNLQRLTDRTRIGLKDASSVLPSAFRFPRLDDDASLSSFFTGTSVSALTFSFSLVSNSDLTSTFAELRVRGDIVATQSGLLGNK